MDILRQLLQLTIDKNAYINGNVTFAISITDIKEVDNRRYILISDFVSVIIEDVTDIRFVSSNSHAMLFDYRFDGYTKDPILKVIGIQYWEGNPTSNRNTMWCNKYTIIYSKEDLMEYLL